MILPNAPIGTEIVCIEGIGAPGKKDIVVVGNVYVLRGHFVCVLSGGHGVFIDGVQFFDDHGREWGFDSNCFRLLEKPAELYSILDRVPVDMETV